MQNNVDERSSPVAIFILHPSFLIPATQKQVLFFGSTGFIVEIRNFALMQSTEFYHTLLHLGSEWRVSRVETNHAVREIDVYLEYIHSDAPSPSGERSPIYDL